jgi:hypothetical protein
VDLNLKSVEGSLRGDVLHRVLERVSELWDRCVTTKELNRGMLDRRRNGVHAVSMPDERPWAMPAHAADSAWIGRCQDDAVRVRVGHACRVERIEVERFTAIGCAVVRMPGRRFPGVVVQGDTLSNLWSMAHAALTRARAGGNDRGMDDLEMVVEDLDSMLKGYEQALERAGLPRPYNLPNRQ